MLFYHLSSQLHDPPVPLLDTSDIAKVILRKIIFFYRSPFWVVTYLMEAAGHKLELQLLFVFCPLDYRY